MAVAAGVQRGASQVQTRTPDLFTVDAMRTRVDPGQQKTTWEFNITFKNSADSTKSNPMLIGRYMEVRAATLEIALKSLAMVAKQYESMSDDEVRDVCSGVKTMRLPTFSESSNQSIQMQANPAGKNLPKGPVRTISWVDTFALFQHNQVQQHSIDEDEIKRIEALAKVLKMAPNGALGAMRYPGNIHPGYAIVVQPAVLGS